MDGMDRINGFVFEEHAFISQGTGPIPSNQARIPVKIAGQMSNIFFFAVFEILVVQKDYSIIARALSPAEPQSVEPALIQSGDPSALPGRQ